LKIAIAADHAGFKLKQAIMERLETAGFEVADLGTNTAESCDYPQYAVEVSRAVAGGQADRGILVCGTGLGMCIAANKVAGIRAVGPCDAEQAEMSRRHNDANVLCLGERSFKPELVFDMVDVWLKTEFEGGRHARRLELIEELEGK